MVVKTRYFLFNHDETKGYYLCVPLRKLVCLTSMLPFAGFIFCIVWSLTYNFKETTYTHCKVWNILPSISAAIGNHMTQYIVWCLVITLHSPARFLFIAIYYRYYLKELKHHKHNLAKLTCGLSTIENISLLGLTYLTSSAAYEFHEMFFITFMASSELHMLMTCFILKYARRNTSFDQYQSYSIRMKTRLLVINVISFTTAGYFFVRHNNYCEPGIYTLFAFFEYIVVLSNIAFHLTALLDFRNEYITIYRRGIDIG